MRQSTPYEFRDSEEIVQRLSEKKDELGRWFDKRIHSLDKIARCGVGSNTFRAFRRMPCKPSVVFRDWASAEFQNHKAVSELVSVNTQREYDQWATGFSGRLSQIWQRQMRVVMPYGSSRKLPNLLKFFVLWDKLSDRQRSTLINCLHVPLDSFTLIGIRNCVSDLKIPKNATMNFVKDETIYNQIQQTIKGIAHKARGPAIYFDILTWDIRH